jgi:2-(1,2-epoxy-1,2-dihydrophenyl)acetyl-CoA isomerase
MPAAATISSTVRTKMRDGVLHLVLDRPGRGNALTPDLLEACLAALDGAADARAIVVTGAGRAFSSGGDVGEFHARAGDRTTLLDYADRVVGTLNRVILKLREMPCPVIAAVNGPVTGGSVGLMLAADTIVMARRAFIQPYYARMGFAPDGGWTALMPERIGRARTARWLALDARIDAQTALEIGLADRVVEDDALDTAVSDLLARIAPLDASLAGTARHLLDTQIAGPDIAERLDNEKREFLDRIAREDTIRRMNAFLAGAT